jgi:hypothetical protein
LFDIFVQHFSDWLGYGPSLAHNDGHVAFILDLLSKEAQSRLG